MKIARVALDVPLEQAFDFRVPEGLDPPRGSLVVVPFGRAAKVGVVVARPTRTDVPEDRLRELAKVVDDVAPLAERDFALLEFCASYYHRPLGEVIQASLPPRLRQAKRRAIKAPAAVAPAEGPFDSPVEATPEQAAALDRIREGFGRFHPVLLAGITGSGKTEVYLRLIAQALARGQQALYLVPEIGLTPQLEERVRDRFPGVRHRGGAQPPRRGRARGGVARGAVGPGAHRAGHAPRRALARCRSSGSSSSTRSTTRPTSSTRGFATRRGTSPSAARRWRRSRWCWARPRRRSRPGPTRSRAATRSWSSRSAPSRGRRCRPCAWWTRAPTSRVEGVTDALLRALKARIARGEQSLVFLNRRGFSPVLFCRSCAWHSTCGRCSANLVLHLKAGELRCHHCGHRERVPARCPGCGSADLAPVGHGTQRIEETLAAALPGARIVRVDRDSTSRKGAFAEMLGQVRDEKIDILVGTQMLAKGHDYPRLTLVGVIDSDCALYSADFRAGERLFSLLTQVAGRAGRAGVKGEVIIQTDFPTHPLYAAVAAHDYAAFAGVALEERRMAQFPPFAHIALLRAESKHPGEATAFLRAAVKLARTLGGKVEIFDPVPAPLERKAGYDRAQLLVRAASRATLQPFLRRWKAALDEQAERRVRWSLDVDPQES